MRDATRLCGLVLDRSRPLDKTGDLDVPPTLHSNHASAEELPHSYHQWREIENAFDEVEFRLLNNDSLRSKMPDTVEQEFWGLLVSHCAIRHFMQEAADTFDIDPTEYHSQNPQYRPPPRHRRRGLSPERYHRALEMLRSLRGWQLLGAFVVRLSQTCPLSSTLSLPSAT